MAKRIYEEPLVEKIYMQDILTSSGESTDPTDGDSFGTDNGYVLH